MSADVGKRPYFNIEAAEQYLKAFDALLRSHQDFLADLNILARLVLAKDRQHAAIVAHALAHKVKDVKPDLDRAAKTCAALRKGLDDYRKMETAIAAAGVADQARDDVRH
jgi:hypothetical protein